MAERQEQPSYSAEHLQAAEKLLDGHGQVTVLAAMTPNQPDDLLAALLDAGRRRRIQMTLLVADVGGRYRFLNERDRGDLAEGRLRIVSLAGATPRRLSQYIDHYPHSMYDVDRYIADGTIAADVFVTRIGPPGNSNGGFGLGPMVGYTPAALSRISCTGAEFTAGLPSFPGTEPAAASQFDIICRPTNGTATPVTKRPDPTPEQERVAELVSRLVPDDATVQLGLGAVPEAVATWLAGKRALGLHSGILPASLRPLIAAGVFTGRAKTRYQGLHLATGILGDTGEPWDERIHLVPISVSHSPDVLRDQHRLWAINSAFTVDLAGQVNAEYAGSVRVAAGGGQSDFVRAAHHSPGGGSVVALPSRTAAGQARIVPWLETPPVPTSLSGDVDYVVTEYGIARLAGATAAARRERLIAIAHPDDRAALRTAAATDAMGQ
jgi:4-hydroxybutyrate CoA-transferase